MDGNEAYALIAQAGRYLTYHAREWLRSAEEADEARHARSVIAQHRRIASLLRGENESFPEPWLDLVELQQRYNACNALPQVNSVDLSDPDEYLKRP
jgi:hypothetical protein